jgi:hypothetical protein
MSPKAHTAALASLLTALLGIASPNEARAQAQYKVGDHVAAPIGAQFFEAVVVKVNPSPLSYRVHPIGFADSSDFTANPQMLRPLGSVQVEPRGGIGK